MGGEREGFVDAGTELGEWDRVIICGIHQVQEMLWTEALDDSVLTGGPSTDARSGGSAWSLRLLEQCGHIIRCGRVDFRWR